MALNPNYIFFEKKLPKSLRIKKKLLPLQQQYNKKELVAKFS